MNDRLFTDNEHSLFNSQSKQICLYTVYVVARLCVAPLFTKYNNQPCCTARHFRVRLKPVSYTLQMHVQLNSRYIFFCSNRKRCSRFFTNFPYVRRPISDVYMLTVRIRTIRNSKGVVYTNKCVILMNKVNLPTYF